MTLSFLEDFDPARLPPPEPSTFNAELEEKRLAQFEEGYAAGWEDAISAQSENTRIANENLAKTIGDLSFTYHEACQHLQTSFLPVLEAMARHLVPPLMEKAFPRMVLDKLADILDDPDVSPLELRCAPERVNYFHETLAGIDHTLVTISSDPKCEKDTILLISADFAEQLDVKFIADEIISEVEAAVFETNKASVDD